VEVPALAPHHPLGRPAGCRVIVVAVVIVLFGPVTDLMARPDAGAVTGPHRAAALQSARGAARGRLLQLGAGLFATGALIYTARNFTLSREGQVTDRYTKAIEQIGSDKLDVRIDGIYALERVTRDSARDHPTIMEVLAAFVRDHSHEQWPPLADNEPGAAPPARRTRPDVQAAVTVLGRRNPRHDRQRINLAEVDLTDANLTDADLRGASLTNANLYGASLTRASVTGAGLTGTGLSGASLRRADLSGASLRRADLSGASLRRADLTGANLARTNLTDANLTGAFWPPSEAVPEGWQRDKSGHLKRADPGLGGEANW
jgi:Pentapeptide repeats (8 copies)